MPENNEKEKLSIFKKCAFVVIAVCVCILFYFLIQNIDQVPIVINKGLSVISSFIVGAVMAFVINPLMKFFERVTGNFLKKRKLIRAVSIVLSLGSVVLFVWIFISVIIPVISQGISGLVKDLIVLFNVWAVELNEFIKDKTLGDFLTVEEIDKLRNNAIQIISGTFNITQDIVLRVISATGSFAKGIISFVLGIIVAIYLLAGKEKLIAQFRKIINAFFPQKAVNEIEHFGKISNNVFTKYISGQLLDALIVGILCFVAMFTLVITGIMNVEISYVLLISIIVCVTNVIPYFGPFIGAIPSGIILLTVSIKDALIFGVLILVIQQIDGNIINPRIMGEATGIDGIWVMLSVTVGGALFGIPGMVLGVPTFAIIYYYINRVSTKKLAKKGLPTASKSFFPPDDLAPKHKNAKKTNKNNKKRKK